MLLKIAILMSILALIWAEDLFAPKATRLRLDSRGKQVRRAPPRLNYDKDASDLPRATGFARKTTVLRDFGDQDPIQARPIFERLPSKRLPKVPSQPPPRAQGAVQQPQQPIFGRNPLFPQFPGPQMPQVIVVPIGIPSNLPQNTQLIGSNANFSAPTMQPLGGIGLPTIPFPTLPPLTMPPSFQRLLGITTTPGPEDRHSVIMSPEDYEKQKGKAYGVRQRSEESRDSEEIPRYSETAHLRSVGERLPKFVGSSSKSDLKTPETNADWIVPF